MDTIFIISSTNSNRLQYVCYVLFKLIIKKDYKIIESINDVDKNSIVINYTNKKINNTFQIVPSGFIDQQEIKEQNISVENYTDLPCMFYSGNSNMPFDLFAAAFYMLSRYEEYLPHNSDLHGRFNVEDSIAFKYNFIELPIVELWAKLLAEKLETTFPKNTFKQLLTIDIDKAWKYKNNSIIKTVGGLVLSFIKLNFSNSIERIKVLSGQKADPYYSFPYLKKIPAKVKIQYFVLFGKKGKYDIATPTYKKVFKNLIVNLHKVGEIGLHPSYSSNDSSNMLKNEYLQLTNIINEKVVRSRQHFLKFTFPYTFQKLIELGIKEDYSMGWSSKVGFRAGISIPFPFYDLSKEEQTNLYFVPFVAMDRTLKDYMGLKPDQAAEKLEKLKKIIQFVGGQFCILWHNSSINDIEWKGWKEVLDATFSKNSFTAN